MRIWGPIHRESDADMGTNTQRVSIRKTESDKLNEGVTRMYQETKDKEKSDKS